MTKAGKKGGAGGQTGSRTGAERGAVVRKAIPKRGGAPTVEAIVVETVEVVPTAGRVEVGDLGRALREALAEVKVLREEVRAARADADVARTACRDALAEARDGAHRLKVEALQAQVAEVRRTRNSSAAEFQTAGAEPARKNRFGVTVAPGVVIAKLVESSPAAVAGLERGDVIEEANGRPIHSGSDLREAVEASPSGAEVTLQLRRAGKEVIRTVQVPAHPAEGNDAGQSRFGVTVAAGVVVAEVFPGSPAAVAGLERGDVIEEANGQAIHSGEQLLRVVHTLSEGSEVPLVVTRAGQTREVVARLDGA